MGMDAPSLLGDALRYAKRAHGINLDELTVLSAQVDPYRLDTPANHRVGRWFAEQMARLNLRGKHLRGIHYALLGSTTMITGEAYINTAECWEWLQSVAAKAARWLGYVEFGDIVDARNDAPIIRLAFAPDPTPTIRVPITLELPDDLTPKVVLDDFMPRQAFHLVLWGEKSSLRDVLEPMAEYYRASLYLPTGEISDTMLHQMAVAAIEDGRPMVVLFIADCDPAGHQMAVSIGHKLRALKDGFFADLEFRVVPIALSVEQVRPPPKPLLMVACPMPDTRDTGTTDYGIPPGPIVPGVTMHPQHLGCHGHLVMRKGRRAQPGPHPGSRWKPGHRNH
jgi:hypothetical protein